ncbi:hypothetical protein ACP70R_015023 [Stipagrostis hirtigluma subsp. patula]
MQGFPSLFRLSPPHQPNATEVPKKPHRWPIDQQGAPPLSPSRAHLRGRGPGQVKWQHSWKASYNPQERTDGLVSTEESKVVVVAQVFADPRDETATITDGGIKLTRSTSAPSLLRILLDGGLFSHPILPSAISSAPGDPAARSTSGGPSGPLPAPADVTVAPAAEDVSKLDLALMACNIALLVPAALNVKDLDSSWETRWQVLYIMLMVLSFVSTITGFLAAACFRANPGATKSSSFCARFGLIVAAALFVVFMVCKLGHFGCAAGVAAAAGVVVLLVVVWILSVLPICQGQSAAKEGASLGHDKP